MERGVPDGVAGGGRFEVLVPEGGGGRLDLFLAARLAEHDLSRSRIQALIKGGHVLVGGAGAKPRMAVEAGMCIVVEVPVPEAAEAQPQDIPLRVLYEDGDMVVVDKGHGMVVHPAAGNEDGTLVNALLHHCGGTLSGVGGVGRPGIVHRLDKDTSGCMVVAKNDRAHHSLAEQFSGRRVSKTYLAVVQGVPGSVSGRIETQMGRDPHNRLRMAVVEPPRGKLAITEYEVVGEDGGCGLVECRILTGRTHQIRVHLRHLGHPILGDPIYAHPGRQPVEVSRLMLHSWKLEIDHPASGERVGFEAEVPEEFGRWVKTDV